MQYRTRVHSGPDQLRSHRHALIAPLFVVAVLLSSSMAVMGREVGDMQGFFVGSSVVQELQTASEREAFVLEDGGEGTAFPYTHLRYTDRGVELVQGSMILSASQRSELMTQSLRCIGFGGSFRVFSQGTSVTVVALTSPVRVVGTDGWEVLVPVGMQWQSGSSQTSRLPRRIPSAFLEEQENELGQLGTSALRTYVGKEHSPLPSSTKDEEWVLFSIHPLMREEFWLSPPPPWKSQDLRKRALLGYPQADILQRAALPLATEKWADDTSMLLRESEDSSEFLGELLHVLQPLVVQWERQGFIERAERYSKAVVAIAVPYRDVLSRADKRRLRAIEDFLMHLGVPRIAVEEEQDSPHPLLSPPASISPASLPTEMVEGEVYEVLREAGALFTIETRIVPTDSSRASVEGVMFGGRERDRTFDFTYDLSTGEVHEVIEGETHYPFAVPLPKFLEWVRR